MIALRQERIRFVSRLVVASTDIMFSTQSVEVSLGVPCRTLAAVRADRDDNYFLVGSCSVQQPNTLQVVRFHSEMNDLSITASIPHETGPVGVIATSPCDPLQVLTAVEQESTAVLWKMPANSQESTDNIEDDNDGYNSDRSGTMEMEQLTRLENHEGSAVASMAWRDSSEDMSPSTGDVAIADGNARVTRWDLSGGAGQLVRSHEGSPTSLLQAPRIVWDPHGNGDALAVSRAGEVHILDWRTDTSVPNGNVESFLAHRLGLCDMDYNPNKPYVLATAGRDGLLKFWDLRAAKHPLLVSRGGHSHWVSQIKYNPFHDQLVLTTGTDSISNLWRISTISSAPLLTMHDDDDKLSETSAANVRVSRHEHSEAVYGASWGAADAWIYACVGYDGKFVLNHVPSKEKYKILL